MLVPELDWPRHVAQHRRGEIPTTQRQRPEITAEQIDLWRRFAQRIELDTEPGGTLSRLANAVLSLLSERERAEVAMLELRDRAGNRLRRTSRVHGGLLAPEAPPITDQEMRQWRELASRPELNAYQWSETNTVQRLFDHVDIQAAEIKELTANLEKATALLEQPDHDLDQVQHHSIATREVAEAAHRADEYTRNMVRQVHTRVLSLEKHALEIEMLVRPKNFTGSPSSLPGIAQRVGMLETSVLAAGGDIAANLKRQTSPRIPQADRDSLYRSGIVLGAGAEPAPPAAEPHQPEPAGELDAHAKCVGLDNGCPECIKARDAERERNPFHCAKRTDGGECTPDDSFHCVHCGRVIVGPPGPRATDDDHGALRSAQIPESY